MKEKDLTDTLFALKKKNVNYVHTYVLAWLILDVCRAVDHNFTSKGAWHLMGWVLPSTNLWIKVSEKYP